MNFMSSITLLFAFAISVQGFMPQATYMPIDEETCEGELEEYKKKVEYFKREVSEKEKMLKSEEEYKVSVRTELEQLRAEIENQKQEIAILKEENARLKQQVAEMEPKKECEEKPDVLSSGWFTAKNGYQYTVTNKLGTFDESEKLCESMGGKLASKGMRDLDLRRGILDGFKPKTAWIGLDGPQGTMNFKWNDGVAGTKENIHWAAGQPNGNGQEMCGQVARKKDYRTNDFHCERRLPAVCEREAP